MLSPASHRVCCLAAMAPALTKAVRQADCLPFVLSKTYSVVGKRNNCSHSAVSNDVTVNKPMPDDRTWCQTPLRCELLIKSPNLVSQNSPVILLRDQTDAELKGKVWHGTKFAEAISAKIRLKTTMNRNHSPTLRNMGLAKANTSLSFQSPKKIQRVMPVSHANALTPKMQRILQLPEKPLDVLNSAISGTDYVPLPSLGTTIIGDAVMPSKLDGIETASSPLVAATASNETPSSTLLTTLPGVSKDSAHIPVSVSTLVALPAVVSNVDSTIPNSTTMECDSYLSSSDNSESTLSANTVLSPSSDSSGDIHNLSLLNDICSPDAFPEIVHTSSPQSVSKPHTELSPSEHLHSPLSAPRKVLMKYHKKSKDIISTLATKSGNVEMLSSSVKLQAEMTQHSPMPNKKLESLKPRHTQANTKCDKIRTQALEIQLKHLNHYIRQQLRGFVEHYQRTLGIPCQRQVRPKLNHRGKDNVDLKSELLQSENVRNLSTAALVSLVRKIESSPEKYLAQQACPSTSTTLNTSDKSVVHIEPKEWDEVKRVSKCLASDVRHLLSSVDDEATDFSSEEDSCEESDVSVTEELQVATPEVQNKAVLKWANERAAVASRWTWLVAQVHDLEYHLRRLDEMSKHIRVAKGPVSFEEPGVPFGSSALPTTRESEVSCRQTSPVKQTNLKATIKPMNGYLDHNSNSAAVADDSSVAQGAGQSAASSDQLESGLDEVESDYCCRTRPLNVSVFRKRKLIHTEGLYQTNTKASRLSTVGCSCNCQSIMQPCVLCGGRYNNVQSVDPDTMPLLERVALLEPAFHPVLSFKKDVPLHLHFENALKMKEPYYQSLTINSQVIKKPRFGAKPKSFSNIRNHSRKLKCYAGSLLSAKYRRKHVRNSGHYRKRGLIFGKWRRLQNKSSLRRVRRFSIASSVSSGDSPIPSPSSFLEDSYGYDQWKKRRDDFQFDIDDVIIPCNSKAGRFEKLNYKDIEIPSWRYMDLDNTEPANEEGETEDASDAVFHKKHERLEIEEKKIIRGTASGTSRRGRRQHRCDSRADSSGANTPDPVLLYQQDIMFQDPNSMISSGPSSAFQDPNSMVSSRPISPVMSPPATPLSATAMSDDSQPSFGNCSIPRLDRKRGFNILKTRDRSLEDNAHMTVGEFVDVPPYEPRVFPLSDREYEEMLKESTHFNDEPDLTQNGLSCPASPATTSESTSTVEEEDDDDITDPEWTIVQRENGPEQALVMKLAKR